MLQKYTGRYQGIVGQGMTHRLSFLTLRKLNDVINYVEDDKVTDLEKRFLARLHKRARRDMILEEAARYRGLSDKERWTEFREVLAFADVLLRSSDCAQRQLEYEDPVPESSSRLWKKLLLKYADRTSG